MELVAASVNLEAQFVPFGRIIDYRLRISARIPRAFDRVITLLGEADLSRHAGGLHVDPNCGRHMLIERFDDLVPACLRRRQCDVLEEIFRRHGDLTTRTLNTNGVIARYGRVFLRCQTQGDRLIIGLELVAAHVDVEADFLALRQSMLDLLRTALGTVIRANRARAVLLAGLHAHVLLGRDDIHVACEHTIRIEHQVLPPGLLRIERHVAEIIFRRHRDLRRGTLNRDRVFTLDRSILFRAQVQLDDPIEGEEFAAACIDLESQFVMGGQSIVDLLISAPS